jgi:hypothetical protein
MTRDALESRALCTEEEEEEEEALSVGFCVDTEAASFGGNIYTRVKDSGMDEGFQVEG